MINAFINAPYQNIHFLMNVETVVECVSLVQETLTIAHYAEMVFIYIKITVIPVVQLGMETFLL